jgi:hypothetical protein
MLSCYNNLNTLIAPGKLFGRDNLPPQFTCVKKPADCNFLHDASGGQNATRCVLATLSLPRSCSATDTDCLIRRFNRVSCAGSDFQYRVSRGTNVLSRSAVLRGAATLCGTTQTRQDGAPLRRSNRGPRKRAVWSKGPFLMLCVNKVEPPSNEIRSFRGFQGIKPCRLDSCR